MSILARLKKLDKRIHNIDDLRDHIQVAIEIEHATIPPYLCALYSIPNGRNQEAARILRGVVIEEMLHMTLAANILNAIDGEPDLLHADFIPDYPATIPHSDGEFDVGLVRFSRDALRTFLKIELPAAKNAPPEAEKFHSIAQFYAAISDGLRYICAENKHFTGDLGRQITPEHYYGSGGEVIVVKDLDSALRAIHEIVDQGEGFCEKCADERVHDVHGRLGHFYRYREIYLGRRYEIGDTVGGGPTGKRIEVDYDAVYPMQANPKIAQYADPELRETARRFNASYRSLLTVIQAAYRGNRARLMEAVGIMYQLKYDAVQLMRIPFGSGTAGPTFEAEPTLARSSARA